MNNDALISVLMGIYNCADTLEEAVNSIINQTYKNWELIMCDDGSTDNTYEEAVRLSKLDSRIVLLKNDHNMTLAPTLNRCLKHAKGDFIARMDGDDICSSVRFEKEIEFLNENKQFSFVSTDMELFDNDGVFRTVHYLKEPTKKVLVQGSTFCHAGVMIRAEVLKSVNGYNETKKYLRVEDYDLWIRLYEKGYIGANIGIALYSMRDDRKAIKRRTFNNRVNETRVKYKAFKLFDLPFYYFVNVLEPLVKFLVPNFIYKIYHKKK